MGWTFSLISELTAIAFLIFVLYVLRSNLIRGGFIVLWIVVSLIAVSVPLAENFYIELAHMLGLLRAADMIMISVIGFCLVYIFYLTIKFQRVSDAVESLVSMVAILDAELADERKNPRR